MTECKKANPATGHPGKRRLELCAFSRAPEAVISVEERAHIETCDLCTRRIEAMRAERAAFLSVRPPEVFIQEISAGRRRDRFSGAFEWLLLPRVLVPAAAAIVLATAVGVYLPNRYDLRDRHVAVDNRISLKGKGNLQLTLFVSRNGAPAVLHEKSEPLLAGDVLKFGIQSRRSGSVTIANIDDKGTVSIYISPDGKGSSTIKAGELNLLNDTIQLDDFVGMELIVAILTQKPISKSDVESALGKAYNSTAGALERIDTLDLEAIVAFYVIKKTNS